MRNLFLKKKSTNFVPAFRGNQIPAQNVGPIAQSVRAADS